MASHVRFIIPAQREFVGLVRLAVSGLAQAIPFDADTVEDIKLVMSEVCTHLVLGSAGLENPPDLVFTVALNPGDITVDIESGPAVDELMSATTAAWTKPKQSGYGLSIISALMDSVELVPNEDKPSILRLKKFI